MTQPPQPVPSGIATGGGGVSAPSTAPAWPAAAMISGRYYPMPAGAPLVTGQVLTNGLITATNAWIPAGNTFAAIGAEVTFPGQVGCVVRLGIYADDGTMRPGVLILDAGTIPGDQAAPQEIDIDVTLAQGWYWFAAAVQGAPTIRPQLRATQIAAQTDIAPQSAGLNGAGWNSGVSVPNIGDPLPATFQILSSSILYPARIRLEVN